MRGRIGRQVLVLGAVGCADIASSDVRTSGMYADLSVVAHGTGGSEVRAVLRAGGATSTTYIDLQPGDRLTATLDGDSTPMVKESLGVIHHYVATFPTAPVGEDYTIAFERTTDVSAPSSTVALPPEFDLAPPGFETFSRLDEDLTVSWSPTAAAPMSVTVSGDCVETWSQDLSGDGGSYVIPRGTLEPRNGGLAEACSLDVTVIRSTSGTVDPAFGEGGAAVGRQERSYTISSTP